MVLLHFSQRSQSFRSTLQHQRFSVGRIPVQLATACFRSSKYDNTISNVWYWCITDRGRGWRGLLPFTLASDIPTVAVCLLAIRPVPNSSSWYFQRRHSVIPLWKDHHYLWGVANRRTDAQTDQTRKSFEVEAVSIKRFAGKLFWLPWWNWDGTLTEEHQERDERDDGTLAHLRVQTNTESSILENLMSGHLLNSHSRCH